MDMYADPVVVDRFVRKEQQKRETGPRGSETRRICRRASPTLTPIEPNPSEFVVAKYLELLRTIGRARMEGMSLDRGVSVK